MQTTGQALAMRVLEEGFSPRVIGSTTGTFVSRLKAPSSAQSREVPGGAHFDFRHFEDSGLAPASRVH
jgi:hypothetical protein